MPLPKRPERINATINEHLGNLILTEVTLPEGCLVTITGVETEPDFKHAKVFISVLPDNLRGSAVLALRRAAPHLTHLLYRLIKIRNVPKLDFVIDLREAEAAKVENILNNLQNG